MGDSFRDGKATPAAVDPVTPEVFPLSDDAGVALLPSSEAVASRRVVLVPLSGGSISWVDWEQVCRVGVG